jgi:NlpC/P60 family putative phage cell wall peptidase
VISRAALIAEARTWLGTPFVPRAAVKGAGCDCVGLLNACRAFALREPLEPMPAYSWDFAADPDQDRIRDTAGRLLRPAATPRAGDVLIFRWRTCEAWAHAALMSGEGTMIHAIPPAGVVETHFGGWADRIAGAFALPGLDD